MKVYMLTRVLSFTTGDVLALPVELYDSGEAAQRHCEERARNTAVLGAAARLAVPTGEGTAEDTGVMLSDYLRSVGIHSVRYIVNEIEVKGALVTPPEAPRIIVAR